LSIRELSYRSATIAKAAAGVLERCVGRLNGRRRQVRLGVAAVAWLALSSDASSFASSAPPAIDAAGYCRQVAALSKIADSAVEVVFGGCMRAEAIARSEISRVWSDVREADESACLAAMPAASPSNQELADCVAAAVARRFLEGDLRFCAGAMRTTLGAP
jgi:hypothetical protein